MNEQFAVDPVVFEDIKDIRYVLDKFGFHEGRFLSAIPGSWKKLLYSHIEKCLPDGLAKSQAKRIVMKMYERGGVISMGLDFDSKNSWCSNVTRYENLFQGILISVDDQSDVRSAKYRTIAGIDETFFPPARETRFNGNIEGYCSVAKNLLELSSAICIVDPYFKFDKVENLCVLTAFIKIGLEKRCKEFIVFTSSEYIPKQFQIQLNNYVQQFNNTELSIKFNFVNMKETQKTFHARFLISSYGAIRFDKGFVIARKGEVNIYDAVSVDLNMHETLVSEFLEGKHGMYIEDIIEASIDLMRISRKN